MPGTTRASVVVVTHQAASLVEGTLRHIVDDPQGPAEVVVVDSASSDGTGDIVERLGVRFHRLEENLGFGAAVNKGFRVTAEDTVVILNHDVAVTPGWLPPLLAALEEPGVGAAMATIELAACPGHFNTSGGRMTVSGIAWVSDYGMPIPEETGPVTVPFPSGAAFAMRRDVWDRIGGMWEDLFLYHEDTDLGWRLRLVGLRTVRVPGSRVAHDYDFSRNRGKLGLLERNRLILLLTNYRRSTVALLAPVLILHELGVLWVALSQRWGRVKLRTWVDVFRRRRAIRERYRSVQAERSVGDAVILHQAVGSLHEIGLPGMEAPRGSAFVSRLTDIYVGVVRPAVAAIDRRHGLSVRRVSE
jgi:GT2 family glycosyltransferase